MELVDLEPADALRFPRVASELLDTTPPVALVTSFSNAVNAWRAAVVAFLEEPGRSDFISDRLARVLSFLLGATERAEESLSPYRVYAFPSAEATGGLAPSYPLRVLVWRSAIVDFLADAWDTVGPDSYEPKDCANAELLFTPLGDDVSCFDCLQPVTAVANHTESCKVRALRLSDDARSGAPWTVNPPFAR
jgi:hypothetical protein